MSTSRWPGHQTWKSQEAWKIHSSDPSWSIFFDFSIPSYITMPFHNMHIMWYHPIPSFSVTAHPRHLLKLTLLRGDLGTEAAFWAPEPGTRRGRRWINFCYPDGTCLMGKSMGKPWEKGDLYGKSMKITFFMGKSTNFNSKLLVYQRVPHVWSIDDMKPGCWFQTINHGTFLFHFI